MRLNTQTNLVFAHLLRGNEISLAVISKRPADFRFTTRLAARIQDIKDLYLSDESIMQGEQKPNDNFKTYWLDKEWLNSEEAREYKSQLLINDEKRA